MSREPNDLDARNFTEKPFDPNEFISHYYGCAGALTGLHLFAG